MTLDLDREPTDLELAALDFIDLDNTGLFSKSADLEPFDKNTLAVALDVMIKLHGDEYAIARYLLLQALVDALVHPKSYWKLSLTRRSMGPTQSIKQRLKNVQQTYDVGNFVKNGLLNGELRKNVIEDAAKYFGKSGPWVEGHWKKYREWKLDNSD